jgi:hypothetical protein
MPFGQIRGRHGDLSIPAMGAVIAKFDGENGYWLLKRHEDGQQPGNPVVYRFHAVLSYLNRGFYDDERFVKVLTLKVGTQLFRVDPIDGQRMELQGRTLQCEGVNLWPIES